MRERERDAVNACPEAARETRQGIGRIIICVSSGTERRSRVRVETKAN